MAKLGDFYVVPPEEWLFATNGDVMAAHTRAEEYKNHRDTLDNVEYQIEEFVRQWALHQLIREYGYPLEWAGEQLVIEEPVKMGASDKEADISLKNKSRRTFLYVETKRRGIPELEFREAEKQLVLCHSSVDG